MLRIGLNLLHALPEIGGGWNYMANLIAAIAREDQSNEYIGFVTDASAVLLPDRPNFRRVRIPINSRMRAQRVLFENSLLQTLARRECLDCMHWFANVQGVFNAAPALVTVYDLQPFMEFGHLPRMKRTLLRWQLKRTARHAAMLLPMSQSTASALEATFQVDAARVKVIPPVLEPMFTPPEQAATEHVRAKYALPEQFWLYVAHMYPHKNHARLLEAYRDLKTEDARTWSLVLRGDAQPGGPNIGALIEQLGLERDVVLLPRLERQELPALYRAASALVFPSLYEGAGIPVMEAQASGCPVVASNIAAVREFAGDAALYFDPSTSSELSNAMRSLAADRAERERLRKAGLDRSRAFTSAVVVADLAWAYQQASSGSLLSARKRKRNSYGRA